MPTHGFKESIAVRAYEVGFASLVALGANEADLDLAGAIVGGLIQADGTTRKANRCEGRQAAGL